MAGFVRRIAKVIRTRSSSLKQRLEALPAELQRLLDSTEHIQRGEGEPSHRKHYSSLRFLLKVHLVVPVVIYSILLRFIDIRDPESLLGYAIKFTPAKLLWHWTTIVGASILAFYGPLLLHILFEPRHRAFLSGQPQPENSVPIASDTAPIYGFRSQWDRNDPRIIDATSRLLPFLLVAAVYLSFCFQILLSLLAILPKALGDYDAPPSLWLSGWKHAQVLVYVQFTFMVPIVLRRIHRTHYFLPAPDWAPDDAFYSGFWVLYNGHSIAIQLVVQYGIWRWVLDFINVLSFLGGFGLLKLFDRVMLSAMVIVSIVSLSSMCVCFVAEALRTAPLRLGRNVSELRSLPSILLRAAGVCTPLVWVLCHLLSGGCPSLRGDLTVVGFGLALALIWLNSPLNLISRDVLELGFTLKEGVGILMSGGLRWMEFWSKVLKGRSALSILILFWLSIAVLLAVLQLRGLDHGHDAPVRFPDAFLANETALLVEGLPIEELSYLALLPYLDAQHVAPKLGWRYVEQHSNCEDTRCYRTYVNDAKRTRVVSFRGGVSDRELALNCALYGNGVIFRLISAIFPPRSFERLPALLDIMADVPNLFWQSDTDSVVPRLAKEVYNFTQHSRDYRNFFVGHGRGGAIAALIGAGLGIRTAIFGSPGIDMLRHRFVSYLPLLHRHESLAAILVSVANNNDFVTSIDSIPKLEVLKLPCAMSLAKPLQCHSAQKIFQSVTNQTLLTTGKQQQVFLTVAAIEEVRKLAKGAAPHGKLVPACWGDDPFNPLVGDLSCKSK